MLAKATRVTAMRRPRSSGHWTRPAFTFFFLLTFLLQGYATQTHIHLLAVPDSCITAVGGTVDGRWSITVVPGPCWLTLWLASRVWKRTL